MTKYWKLTHTYDGYEFTSSDLVSRYEAYLYRHGDFFNKHHETFRRAVTDDTVNEFLTAIQANLSAEFIYDFVEKTYKMDMFLNHGIDAQLHDTLRLRLSGISETTISNTRYHSEFEDTWTDVPKPWSHKDAYLVGTKDHYKITIAPIGSTNKIIDKAEVAYQLTSNGEWTNSNNVIIIAESPSTVDAAHPTFTVRSQRAQHFLGLVTANQMTE